MHRLPSLRPRLTTGIVSVFAALAPTMLVAIAVAIPEAGFGAATTPPGSSPGRSPAPAPAPGGPAPQRPTLFRIAGCRSRGALAYRHGPDRREVAIGFDDGPSRETPAFVRMLERSRARATFFVIGRQLSGSDREVLLRELHDGDALGDHTFSHPDLLAGGDTAGQLREPITALRALTGYTPCVFRPPYGAYDGRVEGIARSLGLATVLWNVDPRDWALPGTRAIERGVLAQVRPGSIIISHDGGGPRAQTLAAYPAIIAALRARGYRLVTVPELLGFRPIYVPCLRLCEGIGQPRGSLPGDALVQRAP